MRKLFALLATLALTLGVTSSVSAQSALTFNDFALLQEHSGGQYEASASQADKYQWAWSQQDATHSQIRWGSANEWDSDYAKANFEHFIINPSNGYVQIDGWGNASGTLYYKQVVSSQSRGDANCNNMTALPDTGGVQDYTSWVIPSSSYCLDATGDIYQYVNGVKSPNVDIHFEHKQVWSGPGNCQSSYISGMKTCIAQHEQWWDDNGHAYGKQLDRTQYIAKGLGMALAIQQTFPTAWTANANTYFSY